MTYFTLYSFSSYHRYRKVQWWRGSASNNGGIGPHFLFVSSSNSGACSPFVGNPRSCGQPGRPLEEQQEEAAPAHPRPDADRIWIPIPSCLGIAWSFFQGSDNPTPKQFRRSIIASSYIIGMWVLFLSPNDCWRRLNKSLRSRGKSSINRKIWIEEEVDFGMEPGPLFLKKGSVRCKILKDGGCK